MLQKEEKRMQVKTGVKKMLAFSVWFVAEGDSLRRPPFMATHIRADCRDRDLCRDLVHGHAPSHVLVTFSHLSFLRPNLYYLLFSPDKPKVLVKRPLDSPGRRTAAHAHAAWTSPAVHLECPPCRSPAHNGETKQLVFNAFAPKFIWNSLLHLSKEHARHNHYHFSCFM